VDLQRFSSCYLVLLYVTGTLLSVIGRLFLVILCISLVSKRARLYFREVQKIVRKSPRDIKLILDKANPTSSKSTIVSSQSSQAYRMFEEGSTPIQVAIALDLREKEVSELYREWWNLNRLYQLNQVYKELANDIWSIAELNRRRKAEGLSIQQVSRILKRITTLERQTIDMECEQTRLEVNNKYAATTFQQFTDSIQRDRKTMKENEYIINKQKMEINRLSTEKARLETTMADTWMKVIEAKPNNNAKMPMATPITTTTTSITTAATTVTNQPELEPEPELESKPESEPDIPISYPSAMVGGERGEKGNIHNGNVIFDTRNLSQLTTLVYNDVKIKIQVNPDSESNSD
jgi:hypothetical protein